MLQSDEYAVPSAVSRSPVARGASCRNGPGRAGPRSVLVPVLVLLLMSTSRTASANEHTGRQPVPASAVEIDDAFWAPRLERCIDVTLPHCLEALETTGRLRNFDRAAGRIPGDFEGYYFNDSDVYKVLEGAAYALERRPDAELEARVDGLIERIATAQRPDGYLVTWFQVDGTEEPWSNVASRHELYCAGHLLEAGIAYARATGKTRLLDVALRFIDHIGRVFGPEGKLDPPGHPEIELALLRLHQLQGERRYLDLARFFLEQRGRAEGRRLFGELCQDHRPLREQTEIVGHAVRAVYLLSALADLVIAEEDPGYRDTLERIWQDTITTRMYVTGGIGSSSHNEGFTVPYDLPNENAYAETCAAIGMVFWSHRMNLLSGEARYADVLERVLYNGLLAGISLEGNRFFYTNPLADRGRHERKPWFACACCPTNMVRFLPALGGYVYARGPDTIAVNLYVGSRATINGIDIQQETRYPWDGEVVLTITPPEPEAFALDLRLPDWCRNPTLQVNGKAIEYPVVRGYAHIQRIWKPGDTVHLHLPMSVERVVADPRVEADRGRVALQRGPLVYCLEGQDNGGSACDRVLPSGAPLEAAHRPDLLGGITVLTGRGLAAEGGDSDWDEDSLYRSARPVRPVDLLWIPYYAWQNRGPSEMAVWLPQSPSLLDPEPVSWLGASASHCYEGDTLRAIYDRLEPQDSADHGISRFTWWPRRGSEEWVRYDFETPQRISDVAVYWFDDTSRGGHCRAPASWKLEFHDGGTWREVNHPTAYGTALDGYNRVTFDTVRTDGLRLVARLAEGFSGGILEWKVGRATR